MLCCGVLWCIVLSCYVLCCVGGTFCSVVLSCVVLRCVVVCCVVCRVVLHVVCSSLVSMHAMSIVLGLVGIIGLVS